MADSFKTRNIKRRPMKRRSEPTEDSSSEDETTVVRRSKNINENNPMVQGTKREKVNKSENEAEDSGDEDSILVSYKSKRDAHPELPKDMGATSTVQIDTDISDATQHTHNNPQNTVNAENGECCQSSSKSSSKISMAMKGPMRAPANLRSTVRWDYQPDICKDYKETGFCGFGDSCKFLHDRTDYKFGWQLERESVNDNQDDDHKYEVDDSDNENLPFKCIICRGSFVDPIVTKCGHYFCEKCVLNRYKKTDRCFVCNTQTNGVFNPAKKLIAALKERPNTEMVDDENSDECDM